MNKTFAFLRTWLAAMLLVFTLPAQAVVYMTDGALAVYDPDETYVGIGLFGGSEIYSVGWIYTDPTYSTVISLTAPDELIGQLEWATSGARDGAGLIYNVGSLLAGESRLVLMGGFPQASNDHPVTQWFSLAAFDMPEPFVIGSDTGDSIEIAGPVPSIPEPQTWAMLLTGLGLIGLMVKRRKHEVVFPVS